LGLYLLACSDEPQESAGYPSVRAGAALLPALLAQQAGAQDLSQGYRQLREILRDLKRSQRQGSELTPERQEQKSNTYGVAGIELGQTLDLTSEQYRSFTCSDHAWYKDLSFA
jgi:hypothetical protein